MSKLSFRARALDASKPMPIYMAEELPDLPDYSVINRAVPQMPTGMQKEEECEHHLQRAIVAGLIIPTPEVSDIPNKEFYDKVYPANYKQPRQLIHMQPFTMEQDIPDYDMDSEDERWLQSQTSKLELSPLKFEEMMDRLEKSSGQTVVTLNEAKALLKEDDDLIIAVFDYWLNKRLKTQHPLILSVKTEQRAGQAPNNPYLAFRRRTEKMQTRKNRKNDEASYEKMIKLRRDLCRAVTLLEFVKKREKLKREYVHLTVEVFEKRYQSKDFSGTIMAEASALKAASRPAFTPIFQNHYTNQGWPTKSVLKDEVLPRREKRQYKKRKHKSLHQGRSGGSLGSIGQDLGVSSDDEMAMPPQLSPEPEEPEDEGQFAFRRNKSCSYHMPLPQEGNWPWHSKEENGVADKRYRFTLTSLSNPRRCIGFARRRVGRGGRIILDRCSTSYDDFWRKMDYSITETNGSTSQLHDKLLVDKQKSDSNFDLNNTLSASASVPILAVSNNNINNKLTANSGSGSFSGGSSSGNLWRTDDCKSDFSHLSNSSGSSNRDLTRTSECDNVKVEIKTEPVELDLCTGSTNSLEESISSSVAAGATSHLSAKEENDEIVKYLQSLKKDWLHFRPKTPPADYEPPCHMLPADDPIFTPSANTPFAMEILPFDSPSSLLDNSTFLTDPFMLSNDIDFTVPITDTRQSQLSHQQQQQQQQQSLLSSDKNVQTVPNTLNKNISVKNNGVNIKEFSGSSVTLNDSVKLLGGDALGDDNDQTVGCSSFTLYESLWVPFPADNLLEEEAPSTSSSAPLLTSSLAPSASDGGGGGGGSGNGGSHSGNGSSTNDGSTGGGSADGGNNHRGNSSIVGGGNSSSNSSNSLLKTKRVHASMLTSPKVNNSMNERRSKNVGGGTEDQNSDAASGNTNGILTQLGFDGVSSPNKSRYNKLYSYPSGVGYPNASSGTLSLHTSAHTLTLNSHHSANILEIPIANEAENKLVSTEDTPNATNNKKTIVRKNNLIMEVT